MIVFIAILAFTVANHTSATIAAFTSSAISALTGARSLLVDAQEARNDALRKSKQAELDLEAKRAELRLKNKKISSLDHKVSKLQQADFVIFDGKRVHRHEAVKVTVEQVQDRTKRVAISNATSALGESIPFYGIAIVAAATSYELYGACQTMKDLHKLQEAINPSDASDAAVKRVCGIPQPSTEELWNQVKNSPRAAWDMSINALKDSSTLVQDLKAPDFSGLWQRGIEWVGAWFDQF